MDIPEILQHFESSREEFPREAVEQAIVHREDITPELLRILEDVAGDPASWSERPDGHIFAMYLLAKFREIHAYPLLLRIASVPGDAIFDLLGDVVTQDFGSILASVSGGDMTGMKALLDNEDANEFVRATAMRALVTLVATGQQNRDEVMAYLSGLFERLDRKPSYVWTALAGYCTDLYPAEVREQIRQAYQAGLIEPRAIHPDDIEEALAAGEDAALKRLRHRYRLIDDVEDAMSWFSGSKRATRTHAEPRTMPANPSRLETVVQRRRTEPKVGRNDPCPCGSGKKFKKCCGN
jgi:hypothetical protein